MDPQSQIKELWISKTNRTLDMRGCVLLIFKLRQKLDGAFFPVNSKLRLLEKKFNSKFWWRHLH